MLNLVLWERDPALWPSNQEERMKLINAHLEMTKKDLESGSVKIWGVSPGGGKGFAITEGEGKDKLAGLLKYSGYYNFTSAPMFTVDELGDVMKAMQP